MQISVNVGGGLAGKYFDSDGINKKSKKKLEREDRAIDFNFGEVSPMDDPYVGLHMTSRTKYSSERRRSATNFLRESGEMPRRPC